MLDIAIKRNDFRLFVLRAGLGDAQFLRKPGDVIPLICKQFAFSDAIVIAEGTKEDTIAAASSASQSAKTPVN